MRLLLVGNYPPDRQQSMQAYARLLLNGCRMLGIDAELVAPRAVLLPATKDPVGFKKWIAYLDKFIIFPMRLRHMAQSADWTHVCDHSNGMYLLWLTGSQCSVTCHDVIAMQAARGSVTGWRTSLTGKLLQKLNLAGVSRARKIVCVSNMTRNELVGLRCDVESKTVVVPNALHSQFAFNPAWGAALKPHFLAWLAHERYFLHVGSDHPRKNRPAVLRIFAELRRRSSFSDTYLVFVGPPPDDAMRQFIEENDLDSRVIAVEDAPLPLLIALYSGAEALIFPSLNEGFGWPVVEAQACGCPVFASNLPPMPEVGGKAAVYIDPENHSRTAAAIAEANLDEMKHAGLKNAARFGVDAMIRELVDGVFADIDQTAHDGGIGTHPATQPAMTQTSVH